MKSFEQLSKEEKDTAIARAKSMLISHVIEGVIEIEMPNAIIQRDFETIIADMRKNENPSKAKDVLERHDAINRELDKISVAAAQGTDYSMFNSLLTAKQ